MVKCPSCGFNNADNAHECEKCEALLLSSDSRCGLHTYGGTSSGQVLQTRYIITRELSSDFTGVKFLAEDTQENKNVMIWALPTAVQDEEKLKVLGHLCSSLKELNDEHLLNILGFYSENNARYIVCEYLDGSTLEQRILSEGLLTLKDVIEIFSPIARSLDSAHKMGFVHGDISADNIFISPKGTVKLANFAIGRKIREIVSDISLDQLKNTDCSAASDIYSLAVCICRSLCKIPSGNFGMQRFQEINKLNELSAKLNKKQIEVLMKSISADPQDRHKSASELLTELCNSTAGMVDEKEVIETEKNRYEKLLVELNQKIQEQSREYRESLKKITEAAESEKQKYEETLIQLQLEAGEHADKLKSKINQLSAELTSVLSEADKKNENQTQTYLQSEQRCTDYKEKIKFLETKAAERDNEFGQMLKKLEQELRDRRQLEDKNTRYENTIEQLNIQIAAENEKFAIALKTAEQKIEELTKEREEQLHHIRQNEDALEKQESKPASKLRIPIMAALILGIVCGALICYFYLKTLSRNESSIQTWMSALSSAKHGEYQKAIDFTDSIIKNDVQFAGKEKLAEYKKQWEQNIPAGKLWMEAQSLAEKRLYNQAAQKAAELVEKYPSSEFIIQARGYLLQWKNLAWGEQQANDLLEKANAAKADGNLEIALETITAAVKLDPNNPAVVSLNNEIVNQKNAKDQADKIAQEKEFSELINQAAEFEGSKQWQNAVDAYEKALEIKKDVQLGDKLKMCRYNLYLSQAISADRAGEIENAVEFYTKALTYDDNPDVQKKLETVKEKQRVLAEKKQKEMEIQAWLKSASDFEQKGELANAVQLYQKAAQSGNTHSMCKLADAYVKGVGLDKDIKKAIEWLEKAAGGGNDMAMFELGRIYYVGENVEKDYSKSLKFFVQAANAGNSLAMYNAARMYQGGLGVQTDNVTALGLYERASQDGVTRATNQLAQIYYTGDIVKKDYNKAKEYYQISADSGDVSGMYNLAVFYHNGIGVKKDDRKAAGWFSRAAENGDIDSMYQLAVMYENGTSIRKDTDTAVYWYQIAAKAGHEDAKKQLTKLGKTW